MSPRATYVSMLVALVMSFVLNDAGVTAWIWAPLGFYAGYTIATIWRLLP